MNPSDSATDPKAETAGRSHEFTPEQNAIFATLGTKMQFVGLIALGLGMVAGLTGLTGLFRSRHDIGTVVAGSLFAIIGYWTAHAGSQFRSISGTRGHDISHLMAALVDLRRFYNLLYWVCLIALISALILLGSSALY